MISCNQTKFTEFLLVGLDGSPNLKLFFFIVLLVIYIMTVIGNLLIISLFLGSPNLQSPMYSFISYLSFTDILLSTNVAPILLSALLKDGQPMSVAGCMTQYFTVSLFSAGECFLLTTMCYDRYLAVCNPLRYVNIMTQKLCVFLMICSWLLSLFFCLLFVTQVFLIEFCECSFIDYVYCDLAPLLQVSCSDISVVELEVIILSVPIILIPFVLVIITYIKIFYAISKISSTSGKEKAFSTCSSHLAVVCTYYGIMIGKYTVPSTGQSLKMNKIITVLYTVVTPLINPIIYSFKNLEIRKAFLNKIGKNSGGFKSR